MIRPIFSYFGLSKMVAPRLKPLVAIVGATGTGKSDLAVDIARKFNGEIVNGDAMQLYQGLPIITNKISEEEMRGVPHHLLSCIGLEDETWTVGKFVTKAISVMDEIRARGKLPILVGGTHYYTQSLLFKDALSEKPLHEDSRAVATTFPILEEPTEILLKKLEEVDPAMAERWHPNERRKIQRSLEIFLKTGKPASQIYHEQRLQRQALALSSNVGTPDEHPDDPGLRYPTLILWTHASKEALYPRLDARVDKMLENGLLSEVESLSAFRALHERRTGQAVDQGRGIWVSIGYKQFLEYEAAIRDSSVSPLTLANMKLAAIEKTQAATRQYAKRQLRWIQIKLLNAIISAGGARNMFVLDGTDLSKWESQVLRPAQQVTERFLAGEPLPDPLEVSPTVGSMLAPKRTYDLAQRPDLWQKKTCANCGTVAVTENDWNLHLKSRAHRRAIGTKKSQQHPVSGDDNIKLTSSSTINDSEENLAIDPHATM